MVHIDRDTIAAAEAIAAVNGDASEAIKLMQTNAEFGARMLEGCSALKKILRESGSEEALQVVLDVERMTLQLMDRPFSGTARH